MAPVVFVGTRRTLRADRALLLANLPVFMNYLDWLVLGGTIVFIVLYGTWKTRKTQTIDGYLRADNSMKWWMIGISIMATQASAVTFLSTPGQAMEDGMRFLQFYFGLPVAMVIISVTMVPIYYRLKVYTAYEYLESRFDLKTRTLAAILFLLLRGLSAGITLYAPAIVLSTILGWPVSVTTIIIGFAVIVYVVSGGSKAVSLTQRYQMSVIMGGMVLAGFFAYRLLPDEVSFTDTVQIAGELGKLNLVSFDFDLEQRYNIWSGLIAGTFLYLSYFGTDQSQVARYLGGASVAESRLGLLFNGLLKIPMQFLILFIGILVYVFYLFFQPPVFHNEVLKERAMLTDRADTIAFYQQEYDAVYGSKRAEVTKMVDAIHADDQPTIDRAADNIRELQIRERVLRDSVKRTLARAIPGAKTEDRDYMFLNFVLRNLPNGIVGLILAVVFSAAMSSMAGELSALATTTTVDVYRRSFKPLLDDRAAVRSSRIFTIVWAILAMMFAIFATFTENLIQFVNIVGSLFYGTILGIFLCAFYIKRIGGNAVFWAAIIAELIVLACFKFTNIAYLLFNLIGCGAVILFALAIEMIWRSPRPQQS